MGMQINSLPPPALEKCATSFWPSWFLTKIYSYSNNFSHVGKVFLSCCFQEFFCFQFSFYYDVLLCGILWVDTIWSLLSPESVVSHLLPNLGGHYFFKYFCLFLFYLLNSNDMNVRLLLQFHHALIVHFSFFSLFSLCCSGWFFLLL